MWPGKKIAYEYMHMSTTTNYDIYFDGDTCCVSISNNTE